MWKNFVLQKRKILQTFFELGLPILFACLLMIIRAKATFTVYPNVTSYQSYSLKHLPYNLTYLHLGLPTIWQMAYSPNTSEVTDIIQKMEKNLQPLPFTWVSIGNCKYMKNSQSGLLYQTVDAVHVVLKAEDYVKLIFVLQSIVLKLEYYS